MSTTDQFEVPVKTWLPPAVFRAYDQLANQRGTTVSELVAVAARQAVTPRPKPRRGMFADPENIAKLRRLVDAKTPVAEIAVIFNVTQQTIYNHLYQARRKQ